MAIGTNNYLIAALLTVSLGLIVMFLTRVNFGSFHSFDYILNFLMPSGEQVEESGMQGVFTRYLTTATLLNVASREQGRKLEYTYSVKFGNEKEIPQFMQDANAVSGLERVNLITAKEDIEY
jgi:hypothetical protein